MITFTRRYTVQYQKDVSKMQQDLINATCFVFFTDGTSNQIDRYELDARLKSMNALQVSFDFDKKIINYQNA